MLEMASSGAKMQPRSIELGMTFQVPILVASSFNNKPGTLIHGGAKIMNPTVGEMRNRVTGVPSEKKRFKNNNPWCWSKWPCSCKLSRLYWS